MEWEIFYLKKKQKEKRFFKKKTRKRNSLTSKFTIINVLGKNEDVGNVKAINIFKIKFLIRKIKYVFAIVYAFFISKCNLGFV